MSEVELFALEKWNKLHGYDSLRMFDVDDYLSSFGVNMTFNTIQKYIESNWNIFKRFTEDNDSSLFNDLPEELRKFLRFLLEGSGDALYIVYIIFVGISFLIQICQIVKRFSL